MDATPQSRTTCTATAPTETPAPDSSTASRERCPFAERFGRPLPREFAPHAAGLGWRELVGGFAPSGGPLHLADLVQRPLGRGRHHFEAILHGPDGSTRRLTAQGYGAHRAFSEMLAQLGLHVEVERYHQYESDGTWCTILRVGDGRSSTWAMGFGPDSTRSGVNALLGAATRLHLR